MEWFSHIKWVLVGLSIFYNQLGLLIIDFFHKPLILW